MATSSDIQYKTLKQYVQLQLDYITANSAGLVNAPLGPFITALCYATGLVAIALQRLLQLVFQAARLNTATGEDVDSFVGDFGLVRNPGTKAQGTVRFSKLVSAPSTIFIPDGTVVQMPTNPPVRFFTIPSTFSNYSLSLRGHTLAAGSTYADVLVEAENVGTTGNVGAGAITLIGSALPGIDSVTNQTPFTSGTDEESDEDLRADFVSYIQTLSKATGAAVIAAAKLVNPNLQVVLSEPNPPTGIVTAYYDDGSGNASGYQSAVNAAIQNVRPVGVRVDATASTLAQFVLIARVQFDPNLVSDVLALRAAIRSSLLSTFNGVPPGGLFRVADWYKSVFNTVSPGDVISTAVLASPPSTTTVVRVLSTEGMVAGQLVQIGSYTLPSGALPTILEVVDTNTLRLSSALSAVPVGGTAVTTFSVAPGQILNCNFILGSVVGSTTTTASSPTSTGFTLASNAGFATDQYLCITDESVAGSPRYFQSIDGANHYLFQVGTLVGSVVTLKNGQRIAELTNTPLNRYNEVGTNGYPMYATGTKVVAISGASVAADFTNPPTAANRVLPAAPNELYIHMYTGS